ncbi:hypothetical protein POX_a00257 [Penicillium oxalicum]|uniref:Uncharacterized protein n=1 Tax=Penicillium oxalicum (strain 114-2 / CGMCC 5302) TaxID=933388 RepID=S7ZWF4_PENO1|nr:hypothetical protein POX_a00257 [Penicillium oxalicum]EPS34774.1 hypothetical protein PDE_09738 [Penicillium oxalicum 114-2]KAI2793673.1 hypothetical protein POX_a00257 [Penicillium oxalicum]
MHSVDVFIKDLGTGRVSYYASWRDSNYSLCIRLIVSCYPRTFLKSSNCYHNVIYWKRTFSGTAKGILFLDC